MKTQPHSDLVVEKLTECQGRLFAYIYSLTANSNDAWDLLQETNRILWRKADDYDSSREFLPWAMTHAYNQVRTARKKGQRDRLVFQDESTLTQIADQWSENLQRDPAPRMLALEMCLARLENSQRQLIHRFYSDGKTISQLASEDGKNKNAIVVALHRIRQKLADCINKRMPGNEK